MGQTRETGDRARRWGYQMAAHVADSVGATLSNPGFSNEASWRNQRILIKSAHYGVPEIGATQATLERIDSVVAALQDTDGGYTIYQVSPAWFQQEMRPSRSPKASHVMMVRCQSVRSSGTVIGRIHADL